MPESVNINKNASKEEKYQQLCREVKSLVTHETDLIANLANITAVLKEVFAFWWVGFYLVKENQLVLGPFQVRSFMSISLVLHFILLLSRVHWRAREFN